MLLDRPATRTYLHRTCTRVAWRPWPSGVRKALQDAERPGSERIFRPGASCSVRRLLLGMLQRGPSAAGAQMPDTVGDWSGVLPRDRDPVTAAPRRGQGEPRTEALGWPAGPPTESSAAERYRRCPAAWPCSTTAWASR